MRERKKGEELTTTLVVTGGSSGIGKEFIRQYGNLTGIERVCNLSRSIPSGFTNFKQFTHIEADFADPASFADARKQLLAYLETHHRSGEILLLNNSGFGSFGLFDAVDVERDAAMIEVNVKAPVVLTAELLPMLKKFGGTVVNVASTAAYQPTPFFITYGASKAFLAHWSLGLWRECQGSKVKVITVCPGPTSTAFFHNAGLREKPDGGRGMTVEKVVAIMIQAIRKDRTLVITGGMNRLIASIAQVLPKSWITRLAYRAIAAQKLGKQA